MKKIILLLITFTISHILSAQLFITGQTDGSVIIEYGENNDYNLYDPQGDNEIYLYLWINENQTNPNLSQQYNDDWNDSSGLVILTYDINNQKFSGTIDFNQHNFSGEGILPAGTLINDFNLILRNQSGNRQSSDLLATDYGFQPVQLANLTTIQDNKAFYYYDGIIYINPEYVKKHFIIEIYDENGKFLKKTISCNNTININKINSRLIIVKLTTDEKTLVKKIIL
jgi:hypothetical protein